MTEADGELGHAQVPKQCNNAQYTGLQLSREWGIVNHPQHEHGVS
jgi:hypothetical protein